MKWLFFVCMAFPLLWSGVARSEEPSRCEMKVPQISKIKDPLLRIEASVHRSKCIVGNRGYVDLSEEERGAIRIIYRETFDTESFGKIAAGRKWRNMGEADRNALLLRIEDFVVINLTNLSKDYPLEKMKINPPKDDGSELDEVLGVLQFWRIVGRAFSFDDAPMEINWEVTCSSVECRITDVHISGWALAANLQSLFGDKADNKS